MGYEREGDLLFVIFTQSAFALFLKENTIFLFRLFSELKHDVYSGKVTG